MLENVDAINLTYILQLYLEAAAVVNSEQTAIYPTPPCSAEDAGRFLGSKSDARSTEYSPTPGARTTSTVLTKHNDFLQCILNLSAITKPGVIPQTLPAAHSEALLSTVMASIDTIAPWLCGTRTTGAPTPKVVQHTMDILVKLSETSAVAELREKICDYVMKFVHCVVVAIV